MIIFSFPFGKKPSFFFSTRCIFLCYLLFLLGYPRYIQPRSTHNQPSPLNGLLISFFLCIVYILVYYTYIHVHVLTILILAHNSGLFRAADSRTPGFETLK